MTGVSLRTLARDLKGRSPVAVDDDELAPRQAPPPDGLALVLLVLALLVDMPRSLRVLGRPHEWLATVRTSGSHHGLVLRESPGRGRWIVGPPGVRWHGGTAPGARVALAIAVRVPWRPGSKPG